MPNAKKISKSPSSTVVLLSGGLDSATCLYLAMNDYEKVYALSFNYGQRHKVELRSAKKLAKLVGAEHYIAKIQTGLFQGSSLTDPKIKVPKNALKKHLDKKEIPNTYVPGRNILFLSYALSFAESRNCESIYIGVNALDYSGYPDCRPDFIRAYQSMIGKGTKAGVEGQPVRLLAPLMKLGKTEIVQLGNSLGVPYEHTFSCYDPDPKTGKACGKCDSCILRKKALSVSLK
ncbi:MAG: 7-cyano-7-deazaguanine synthase QueC [Leptospira sp.]|nr:7-cyano-7-deazaguanine synthase QueC [Leptospira sp.]